MQLIFVNGSRQNKRIIESDYMEDIIDMILDFFETHNRFPHIMYLEQDGDDIRIRFNGTSEHFRIQNVDGDSKEELEAWIEKYNK